MESSHHTKSLADYNSEISEVIYKTQLSSRQIRTVTLHKGHNSDEIRCTLSVKDIDENPVFDALSYTWGSDKHDLKDIVMEKRSFKVTNNLRRALERIRSPTEDLAFWIDALCINQSNHDEKSEQVKLMTELYTKAKSTMVWLGPEEDGSEAVMMEINRIGARIAESSGLQRIYQMMIHPPLEALEKSEHDSLQKEFEDLFRLYLDENLLLPSRITDIRRFLSREYWTRVWIQQEFIVGSELEILCGNQKVPFHYLNEAILLINVLRIQVVDSLGKRLAERWKERLPQHLEKMQNAVEPNAAHYVDPIVEQTAELDDEGLELHLKEMSQDIGLNAANLCGRRRRFQDDSKQGDETLFKLLAKAHVGNATSSTDPRDKVFALLTIASDDGLGIEPRYGDSNSVASVFTETAKAIIEAGNVDLLSLCQCSRIIEAESLPSWVPDWRSALFEPRGQLPWETNFNASFSNVHLASRRPSEIRILNNSDLLLEGYRVDTVEMTKSIWNPNLQCCPRHCNREKRDYCVNHASDPLKAFNSQDRTRVYMNDVTTLCMASNNKVWVQGADEIYKDAMFERSFAHKRLPVCDQEQVSIGTTRKSTEFTIKGWDAVQNDFRSYNKKVMAATKTADLTKNDGEQNVAAETEHVVAILKTTLGQMGEKESDIEGLTLAQLRAKIFERTKELHRESGIKIKDPEFSNEKTSYYTMMQRLQACRPFITPKGYIGLGPECMQEGDIVVIFLRAKLPYVLRPIENQQFTLIGEAYVQGLMYGEFMDDDTIKSETFVIV